MATVTAVSTVLAGHKLQTVLWETLLHSDVGSAFEVPAWVGAITMQAMGTWNTETLSMQGSNDGTTWFAVTDLAGAAVALTADGGAVLKEGPRYIRPSVTSGTGVDLDCLVLLRRN